MSCFHCGDNCLRLDDLDRCESGIQVDNTWLNGEVTPETYAVIWSFAGEQYRREFTVAPSGDVEIPDVFQRGSVIEFYVLDPEGVRLTKTVAGTEYNCFKILISTTL